MGETEKYGKFIPAKSFYVSKSFFMEDKNGETLVVHLLKKVPESFKEKNAKNKVNEDVKGLPLFGKKEEIPTKPKLKRKKNGFDISNAKECYLRSELVPITKKLVEQFGKDTEYSRYFKDRLENIKDSYWNQDFAGYILCKNGRPLSIRRLRDGKVQPSVNVFEKVQQLDTIFNLLKTQIDNYYGFSIGCIFTEQK